MNFRCGHNVAWTRKDVDPQLSLTMIARRNTLWRDNWVKNEGLVRVWGSSVLELLVRGTYQRDHEQGQAEILVLQEGCCAALVLQLAVP